MAKRNKAPGSWREEEDEEEEAPVVLVSSSLALSLALPPVTLTPTDTGLDTWRAPWGSTPSGPSRGLENCLGAFPGAQARFG